MTPALRPVSEPADGVEPPGTADAEQPAATPGDRPSVELMIAGHPHRLVLDDALGVSAADQVTRLPGAPPGVAGLLAVRGRLVVVFDLAVLLDIGRAAPDAHVLLAAVGAHTVGVLVDEIHVDELVEFGPAAVDEDPVIEALLAQVAEHVMGERPLRSTTRRAARGPVLALAELLPIGTPP